MTENERYKEIARKDFEREIYEQCDKENIDEHVLCPFCKEPGFDLPGLKDHLSNYCDEYNKTETL